jgi:hypothetical protein
MRPSYAAYRSPACLTASSLNSAVYACFGSFFIACLPKFTLILRYLWKTKFQGKLTLLDNDGIEGISRQMPQE